MSMRESVAEDGTKMAATESGLCRDLFGMQQAGDAAHVVCEASGVDMSTGGLASFHVRCPDFFQFALALAETVQCAVDQVFEAPLCLPGDFECADYESPDPLGHGCSCRCNPLRCVRACPTDYGPEAFACGSDACASGGCICGVCRAGDVLRCPEVAGQAACRVTGCGAVLDACDCLYAGAEDGVLATDCVDQDVDEECDDSADAEICGQGRHCEDFRCVDD